MLKLIHHKRELGTDLEVIVQNIESPFPKNLDVDLKACAWEVIVKLIVKHTDSVEQWDGFLSDAVANGLSSSLVIDSGPSVFEIIESGDQAMAKDYVEFLLGEHNLVGWWLEHNIDEDSLRLVDALNNELDILSLVPVEDSLIEEPEDYALFFPIELLNIEGIEGDD